LQGAHQYVKRVGSGLNDGTETSLDAAVKTDCYCADVTPLGGSFHMSAPETGIAPPLTTVRPTGGTKTFVRGDVLLQSIWKVSSLSLLAVALKSGPEGRASLKCGTRPHLESRLRLLRKIHREFSGCLWMYTFLIRSWTVLNSDDRSAGS